MGAEKDLNNANKHLENLRSFSYTGGLEKDYKASMKDYNDWADNPEKYGYNAYINDVNDLFEQIMSQEQFSYDPQKDALFQMYKKQYETQGNRAMQNQMGVASAYSGGYNSSVAQTSAQQQFQNSMDELSQKAAETYQNSLDMYKYQQQNLLDRYNVTRDMNNTGNDAYWKQLGVKQNKANNAYTAYTDDKTFQYNQYSDDRNYWSQQKQNAQSQINWQKDYNQTENWNRKNYNLNKKVYNGK
nr:MAG TPA: hypothetical protein [Caudoviricetes sp.]